MGTEFDLSLHNCATCRKYKDCPVKEIVDIFKNNKPEYEKVNSELKSQLKEYMATFLFNIAITKNLEEALAPVMLMGYAKAKKEESIERLSKLV